MVMKTIEFRCPHCGKKAPGFPIVAVKKCSNKRKSYLKQMKCEKCLIHILHEKMAEIGSMTDEGFVNTEQRKNDQNLIKHEVMD